MLHRSVRGWIWSSLTLQGLGYVYDAIWHGLLNPGFEPQTSAAMARHLATVHLPLYLGAAALLVSTSRALLRRIERATVGVTIPTAVVGAALSVAGETWHALSHLRLDTHSAPVAGALSFVGFLIVVVAMVVSSIGGRRRRAATSDRRRAA